MMESQGKKLIYQIIIWTVAWLILSFFLTNGFENPKRFIRHGSVSSLGIIIVVILNVQYLIPRFFYRKQHALYVLFGITVVGLLAFFLYSEISPFQEYLSPRRLSEEARNRFREARGNQMISGARWIRNVLPFIFAMMGSTMMEVWAYAGRKEKEAIQAEKEKLETEVKFLKSQINPHFLFNALNNIYSLSVMQAPQTSDRVMQLSEILRYMVYDSNEERVPLRLELNYIENFVELQKLKDSRKMNISLELDHSRPEMRIAPLLFIPFVENAFKHSHIEQLDTGFIDIKLRTTENEIDFYVLNSLPEKDFQKDKVGGVGLENVKKRLNILYPEPMHKLNVIKKTQSFEVHLNLKLHV